MSSKYSQKLTKNFNQHFLKMKSQKLEKLGNMAHVNVITPSFYIYQMKAYFFSFELVPIIFQNNENVQVMML